MELKNNENAETPEQNLDNIKMEILDQIKEHLILKSVLINGVKYPFYFDEEFIKKIEEKKQENKEEKDLVEPKRGRGRPKTKKDEPKKEFKKRGRPKKYEVLTKEIIKGYNQTFYNKNVKNKFVKCDICNKDFTPLSINRHNQTKNHKLNCFLKQEELNKQNAENLPNNDK